MSASTSQYGSEGGYARPLAVAGIVLGGLFILLTLYLDIQAGGSRWNQADWLINNEILQIRRGPFGSLIILLSDTLGTDLLRTLGVIQAVFTILAYGLLAYFFARLPNRPAYTLLLLSPALFLIFWFADPGGSLRKEVIAYAAIGLLILGGLTRSRLALAAACLLLVLSCVGHEANSLFLPLFLLIALYIFNDRGQRGWFVVVAIALSIAVALTIGYALAHKVLPDVAAVCDPLLRRGLSAKFCTGAIEWLSYDEAYWASQIRAATQTNAIITFPLSYPLASAPIFYFILLTDAKKKLFGFYLLLFLPFVPLFMMATDWGRWMSFHVASVVFLFTYLSLTQRITIVRPCDKRIFAVLALLGLLWSPYPTAGINRGGVIKQIGYSLYNGEIYIGEKSFK